MFGQKKPIAKIFINYRRDDSRWVAGRLIDALSSYFGDDRVFRDVEGIAGGVSFGNVIQSTMQTSDAVIVLIGPDWLTAKNENGDRRLDDPNDWVAREIEVALQKDIPVFPVLIDITAMPRRDELPDGLKPLVDRNAMSISDLRFDSDFTRLAKAIAFDIPGSVAERTLDWVRLLVSILLLLAMVFTTGRVTLNAPEAEAGWWETDKTDETPQVEKQSKEPTNATAEASEEKANKPNKTLIKLWEAGIAHAAIIVSSVLLLVFAPLVDESRRQYVYASGLAGFVGTGIFYALMLPLSDAVTPVVLFFGAMVTATAMFVLMNLSGFKPK